MVRRMRHETAVAVATLLCATLAAAGQSAPGGAAADPPSVDDQLREMHDELERMRSENARMNREIDELRAATSENWLTEQRSEEIRAIVTDVLADADTRASLLTTGLAAGWSDHFFLASPDGRFKLEMDGQIQFRWALNYHDQPDRYRKGFEMTRAKLTWRGHVFSPDITYLVRTDITRNEPGLVTGLYIMRDAWVRFQLDDQWSLQFGVFKLPFNREELISSQYQQTVERTMVNENMNLGRSVGLEFTYADAVNKFQFMTSDGAADSLGGLNIASGLNPNAKNALDPSVEYALTARYEWLIAGNWQQFEDMTSPPGDEFGMLFGIAAHAQQTEANGAPSASRNEIRWFAATSDLSIEFGGANVFASAMYSYVDNPQIIANVLGLVLQGGVYLTPKFEVFGRVEYGFWDPNTRFSFQRSDMGALTVGFNYYLDGHDLKWTTDLGFGLTQIEDVWAAGVPARITDWRTDEEGAEPQVVFRTQFQLLF